jgi:hypothetical protein
MDGATPLKKACLIPPALAAVALIALVRQEGYISSSGLALGALCAGVVSSLLALALALRPERPHWLRWAAAGEAAVFLLAAAWLLHFLSTVPLS